MSEKAKNINDYLNSILFRIFIADKKNLAWIFLASSIANLLMLTPMLFMLQIFDRIFISKSILTLVTIAGIVIFFYVISAISQFIRSQVVIAMGLKLEKQVNEKLFYVGFEERLRKSVKSPSSYLDDLTLVRQWVTGAAIFSVFDLPWVPFYILVMFVMHPILGYTSLIMILILIAFGLIFSKILGNQDELMRQEEFDTNELLYGKLRNSEVLSVYALASNFKSAWFDTKRKFYIRFADSQQRTDAIVNILKQYRFFSNSLALSVGAILVIYGELTIGSMIAASLLMQRTTVPVDGAVNTVSRISVVKEAFWRLEEMLSIPLVKKYDVQDVLNAPVNKRDDVQDVQYTEKVKDQKFLEKGISLENVNASYNEGKKIIFEAVNLELPSKEVIALVGGSGAGKTTLIKLLSGLVDYTGDIKFDDKELKTFSGTDYYDLIGYLPQDVVLAPGSIADNIAGFRKPDSERVVNIARSVGIHDFILKFPDGYDTDISGSIGILSGGERQRLGLARAIYNEPACLFLDEPNSALDYNGEKALEKVILSCKDKGMLILIVTHRRSVLGYSDKVLSLSPSKGLQLTTKDDFLKMFKTKDDFDKNFTF